jgi:hypothetical protein
MKTSKSNYLALFIVIGLLVFGVVFYMARKQDTDTVSTKVILGLTIDKSGSIVASDPQIEYFLPGIEKKLETLDISKSVRYLPPLAVNHEDRITGKAVSELICDASIQDIFKFAFNKYAPEKQKVDDYTLLVARRVFSDARPLISVWWFTCIRTDELKHDKSK